MLGLAESGFMITQIIFLAFNQLSNYELTRLNKTSVNC